MPSSDYLDEQILRRLFEGQSSFPLPSTLYVALFTGAPTKAGGGTEVSGFGYIRPAVPATSVYWGVAGPTWIVRNVLLINFGQATGGAWGTITHVALMDAASGGNMLFFGALSTARTVADGDPVVFNRDALQMSGV